MNVTLEEAYIVKKQLSLNLHYVSVSKIREKFEPLIMVSARGEIT